MSACSAIGRRCVQALGLGLFALVSTVSAETRTPAHADVVYATVGERELALDVYLPDGGERPPLVVWVHGGAWQFGSKDDVRLAFVDAGYATASVDFRQATDARFPAQAHDIHAAIRFLRANAERYGFDGARIAIAGASSGGHLAALVGLTGGHAELAGDAGGHRDQSSDVQAIVSYYGMSNLTTILAQSTPHGLSVREPALRHLIGGLPDEGGVRGLAELASPVTHVGADAPPLLLLHGEQDPQVPISQAHELVGAYRAHGRDAHLEVVYGEAHGGDAFYAGDPLVQAVSFLRRVLGH